jgi:hypothetical protein
LFNTDCQPYVGPLITESNPFSKPPSVGVPEVWRSFDDQFLTIRFPIGPSEIDKVFAHQKNVESLFRGEQMDVARHQFSSLTWNATQMINAGL